MTVPEAVTVACDGAPEHRRAWYAELARLIASSPPPAGVLLETASDRPTVRLTVRPREVLDLLRRGLAGAALRLEERPGIAPMPPPGLAGDRFGYVVRAGRWRALGAVDSHAPVDRVGVAPGLGPTDWLGLQTFWLPARRGALWLARRFWVASSSGSAADACFRAVGTALAAEWSLVLDAPATFGLGRGFGCAREWQRGGLKSVPPNGWFERSPHAAARLASSVGPPASELEPPVETPAIVLGASGAGKTTYLARWAARVVNRGEPLFGIDLHGDLAPAIVARLTDEARRRVVAVDATRPPVAGVAALVSNVPEDRAAAHLVAALKRLSPDGTDVYWGFRLERIFETFSRLALESGGSLRDVYDLLTDPDRRDAARLATRSKELARFLDELAPVVRRNPEFLWSAAARLSKVVLVPALRDLLAPEEGGLPVESLLARGRSLLVRVPFASLGPEAASFAASLVLGRVYLGVAAAAERDGTSRPVSVVLDEVQALSPRLVAELLTEGRKFGFRTIVATQYPDRLSRELQSAARGALRGFVTFRVPRPAAPELGSWLGLGFRDATELLPDLPTGEGLVRDSLSDRVRLTALERTAPAPRPTAWPDAVQGTRIEFSVGDSSPPENAETDAATERLLLAVLSGTEAGMPVAREHLVSAAARLPGARVDPALLLDRTGVLLRERALLEERGGGLFLTAAGERTLGLTVPTGATRETGEHRALLMATFRRFARRGYRLEILRQGRFDTTLPDARFRQLPGAEEVRVPSELAAALERARAGWAWRFFRGRDVFVEAEVSGALRAERIRHGVEKALRRGAFVLFVVGDAHRARRVRSVLRTMGLGVDRAQVWTLGLGAHERGAVPAENR